MITLQERFESKFEKTDGCWNWRANKSWQGYGKLKIARKMQYAHRISYRLYVGEIPDGLQVLHKCDCPSCVRPDHLFLGTNADNMRDRDNKGRGYDRSGEKNGQAKLTDEQARMIRAMRNDGARNIDLAKEFGVSKSQISRIVCGRRWVAEEEKDEQR